MCYDVFELYRMYRITGGTFMKKRLFALLLSCVLLTLSACGTTGGDPSVTAPASETEALPASALTVSIEKINKHGNVILATTFDEMNAAGIEVGDIITVTVSGEAYDMPVGNAYSDVDTGEMLCRFDMEDNQVAIGINMGDFATTAKIAQKQEIDEEPGYLWEIKSPDLSLKLKEKKGYLDEYNARNLTRTNERGDYAELMDGAFANFREVQVSGLKRNMLYRGSSPLRDDLGRNVYMLAAMEDAGVKSVINLDDSEEVMKGYDTYAGSYYSTCEILNPEMDYDYGNDDFSADVKACVEFIISNDGPFLIHCKEGKDRTGILCAILECFAGATAQEICDDYMLTYMNFYHITPDDTSYGILLKSNLVKTLCGLLGVDHLESADLEAKANDYLLSTGITEEALASLYTVLCDAG